MTLLIVKAEIVVAVDDTVFGATEFQARAMVGKALQCVADQSRFAVVDYRVRDARDYTNRDESYYTRGDAFEEKP